MMPDPQNKNPRTFQCRDYLWDAFEGLAQEMDCTTDSLVNEAMRVYLQSKARGGPMADIPEPLEPRAGGGFRAPGMGGGMGQGMGPGGMPGMPRQGAMPGPPGMPGGRPPGMPGQPPPMPGQMGGMPGGGMPGGGMPGGGMPGGGMPRPGGMPPMNPGGPQGGMPGRLPPMGGPQQPGGLPPMNQGATRPPGPPGTMPGGAPMMGGGPPRPPMPGAPPPMGGPGMGPGAMTAPRPMGGQPMGGQPMGGQPMGGQPMGGQPMGGPPPMAQPMAPRPPAPGRQGGTLVAIYEGQQYPVTKEEFVIGRGQKTSDLTIRDSNVSRRHACVVLYNGQYWIVDQQSTNGVEYNGAKVDKKVVEHGDVYRICDHEIQFVFR